MYVFEHLFCDQISFCTFQRPKVDTDIIQYRLVYGWLTESHLISEVLTDGCFKLFFFSLNSINFVSTSYIQIVKYLCFFSSVVHFCYTIVYYKPELPHHIFVQKLGIFHMKSCHIVSNQQSRLISVNESHMKKRDTSTIIIRFLIGKNWVIN